MEVRHRLLKPADSAMPISLGIKNTTLLMKHSSSVDSRKDKFAVQRPLMVWDIRKYVIWLDKFLEDMTNKCVVTKAKSYSINIKQKIN
jgi:hypothetical protein